MKALIIIDMQNDFMEGGPKASSGSLEIVPIINRIRDDYDIVFFARDNHPHNHCSFVGYGGDETAHCIQGTPGADINPSIIMKEDDVIINKGTLQKYESYSAFYNAKPIDKQTRLESLLKNNGINDIYICGIGFEDCIFSTLMDAVRMGYNCNLLKDAITYSSKEKYKDGLEFFKSLGVNII